MRSRKGFAYMAALLFAFLIINFSYCVKIYKQQSAFLVDYESESYIAYMVAESGINCAIAELEANFEWRTDSCEITGTSTYEIEYKPVGKTPEFVVTGNTENDFSVAFDKNAYTGKMSIAKKDDAEFRVRAGIIKTKDNPNTSIDESNIFYAVKSIGRFGDQYKEIEAVIEISYVNRFILFDGDAAVVCYGGSGRSAEDTILAKGDIYSKNHLMLGTTEGSGMGLNLLANPNITTGKNGVISFPQASIDQSSIYVTKKVSGEGGSVNYVTKKLEELTHPDTGDKGFKAVSTRVREVLYGNRDNDSVDKKVRIFTHGGLFKDKYTGGKDLDITYESTKSLYRKLADGSLSSTHGTGVYLSRTNPKIHRVVYPNNKYKGFAPVDGGTDPNALEVMMIDFGELVLEDDGDDFGDSEDYKIPGPKPSNYNGVIYAEVPLVIWGNPDRDTIIYSEYDIYVAGDLNQRQTESGSFKPVRQDYNTSKVDEFGWNLFYEKYLEYRDDNANYRETHEDKAPYWNNVDLISETRIFYDLTDPKKAFRNELVPFLVYEIYERLFYPVNIDSDEVALTDIPADINISGGGSICEEARKYSVMYDLNPAYTELNGTKNISFDGMKSVIGRIYEDGNTATAVGRKYLSKEGTNSLMDYLKNELYFSQSTSEAFLTDITDLLLNDQKLVRDEVFEFVEDKLWPALDNKAFLYVVNDGAKKKLGLAARLHEKTGKEDLTGNEGLFYQGKSPDMKEDMLYIPEMTVNAKRISMGVLIPYIPSGTPPDNQKEGKTNLWDCDSDAILDMQTSADFTKLDQIRRITTIREVIGNYNNDNTGANKEEGLTLAEAEQEVMDNYFRYISSDTFYLRTFGSEVFLRNMNDVTRLPYIGGGYGPHVRKKVFDPENRTKYELRSYNLLNLEYVNSSKKAFDEF